MQSLRQIAEPLDILKQVQHARNATFQGIGEPNNFEGFGIIQIDPDQFVLAEWRNGCIQGSFCMTWGEHEYMFGRMQRSRLQGISYLKSRERVVVGQFRQGLPYRQFIEVILSKNLARLIDYQNKKVIASFELQLYSDRIFDYVVQKARQRQFLMQLSRQHFDLPYFLRGLAVEKELVIPFSHIRMGELDYFGFIQNDLPQGLGITIKAEDNIKVAACGQFHQGQLHGNSRIYMHNQFIFDGFLNCGKLHGKGLTYRFQSDSFELDMFEDSRKIMELDRGHGKADSLVSSIRKQQRLMSLNLHNTYVSVQTPAFPDLKNIREESQLNLSPLRARSKDRIKRNQNAPARQRIQREISLQDDFLQELRRRVESEEGTSRVKMSKVLKGESSLQRVRKSEKVGQYIRMMNSS